MARWIEIKNDGTDEEPSWGAYTPEGEWLNDNDDLATLVAWCRMLAAEADDDYDHIEIRL